MSKIPEAFECGSDVLRNSKWPAGNRVATFGSNFQPQFSCSCF
jgi:hypothetical protein